MVSPRPSLALALRHRLPLVASYGLVLLAVAIIGLPLLWMVLGSVKTNREIYTLPPPWLPAELRWQNFVEAWNAAPFDRFYLNTIITTLAGVGLELVNAVLTAYALAFLRFPKKNLVFVLLLAALMIPTQVTILPNYLTLSNVFGQSWINTYQGIVLPGAATAFGAFLLRQSFLGLPREVLDAAKVDGCGHLRLLWDVVLPMARPVLVTFGLISLVAKWNDYLWPLIVTNQDVMRTLTVGLTYLFDAEGNTDWGPIMAASIFVIVPLLVVYVWAQKYIIEGITAGATKG
ncbi:MAG: ABC transporter, permease protein 2 (cluster 1, maltose/g3p/polyamine/iron) [uncultured Thermomicrobiales bacterium]|jgi:sn-glycerol 3-phosphate transport system permease protein|uniref:ABC transporter, permease protein 2 (Cluster 1, maltose/g3p/polyamine/iron) n=1 Tax=uncultured Thermomicrobiales bacterium TaxID=1645740 RepID=A0A6J4UCI4_9BACT|nr:MAG: ABC transporter, permease protein 2 (cluster 1, maltose/g3p/polyamine/iron) [uncultured Thermomicrobiales bacterium]